MAIVRDTFKGRIVNKNNNTIKLLRDSLFELTCKVCDESSNKKFKHFKNCLHKKDCEYYKYNRIIYKIDKEFI